MTTVGTGEYRSSDKPIEVTTKLEWRPRDVTLWATEVDDVVLFEGDIALATIREYLGSGRAHPRSLWPQRTVFYDFSDDFSRPEDRKHIDEAIAQWADCTVMKFVRRRSAKNVVIFRSGSGCCSNLGMDPSGTQFITLGLGCNAGNALHEIGHAVGLCHEHARPDRDKYVEIHWCNIDKEDHKHFNQPSDDLIISTPEYDYDSIMHYLKNAFASDPAKPTITARNGARVGQREKLSPLDIRMVEMMYEDVKP